MLGGAEAGAAAGGLMGGLGGLVSALPGIGLAFGAYKLGQYASQGYDMAKERGLDADALKRQMGDLGVSFEKLKQDSDGVGAGLGVASVEGMKLAAEFNEISHNAARGNTDALRSDTRTSIGFARAYGMDPSQAIGFFGGMAALNPRQSNRELALMIAEAIEKSGGRALPADVMQAVQSLSSSAAHMSLSNANVQSIAAGYSSMVRDGVHPDVAQGLIGTADASMMHMGAAGEAGQNFLLSSFNAEGGTRLNPVMARALAAGGLFATRQSTFGARSVLGRYFGNDKVFAAIATGPGASMTNLDAARNHLDRAYAAMPGGRWLELDAAQRLFAVSSPQQAAELMMMSTHGMGSLQRVLKEAGVTNLDHISADSYQTLAKIGDARSMSDLRGIYTEVRGRTGDSALSPSERSTLDSAEKSGDAGSFRHALLQVMANKGQEDTTASDLRKATATLDSLKTDIGDKLVTASAAANNLLATIATKLTGTKYGSDGQLITDNGQKETASLAYSQNTPGFVRSAAAWWEEQRAPTGDALKADLAMLSATEKKYSLPANLLKGVWGTESSFGKNLIGPELPEGDHALGNFQFRKSTADMYGVKLGDFASEQDGAGRYLRDLLKKNGGDVRKALFDYAGVVRNVKAGNEYVARTQRNAGSDFGLGTSTPVPTDAGSAAPNKIDVRTAAGEKGKIARGQDTGLNTLNKIDTAASGQQSSDRTPGQLSMARVVPSSADSAVRDVVVLDMNLNVISDNGAGSTTVKKVKSSVAVPRGSGTQRVGVHG
ncbi:lytic transglycosylase domain-containing protein [Burkholderia stagnalis]|nr:lytic transglycosylase domain-containing protein [Burkholderia stagnalis]RQX93769.1 lytic transglycosylase domain-containing protein [Burkholderia stagnalis]RQY83005.1 lytic transglycosylase domain-containing protein [Burkholderia stagnalis]